MTNTITQTQPRAELRDHRRSTKRRRRDVEVRRVAVVHPGGAHFKLLPVLASLASSSG